MDDTAFTEAFPIAAGVEPCAKCGTNHDGQTVLVALDGTADDGLVEALPVHLACAVATNLNLKIGVLYRKTLDA